MNPSINSYRFFAFFAVFLFHVGYFSAGYLGVQAFFVLSGFLITPILFETKNNSSNFYSYLKNFLTRRFLRIFPLYYAYLIAIPLAIIIFGVQDQPYFASLFDQLIYGFTYTYNFYHQTDAYEHNRFITHFWSLAVEEQFYLFWPILIYFLNFNKLKRALIFICLLTPLIRLTTGYIVDIELIDGITKNKDLIVYLSTFSHIDAFALGGLFGILPNMKVRNVYIIVITIAIVAIGLALNYFIDKNLNIKSLGYPPLMSGAYRYIWGYSAVNVCFGLILVGLRTRTFLPWVFEMKILTSLGLVSYGLYVYHYGITWVVSYFQMKGLIYNSNFLYVSLSLILTILISYMSFYLFEKKFIDLKDRLAPKSYRK